MFRKAAFIKCMAFVLALMQLSAARAGEIRSSSSDGVGACKQKDCVAAFFIAESQAPRVLIFNHEAKVIGAIVVAPGVTLLATDHNGRLYTSNFYRQSTISIYSPPLYNSPVKISVPSGKKAGGVAVDTRSGRFAVFSGVNYSGEEVQIYEANSTKPCAALQNPTAGYFFGTGAFDRDGTLYAPVSGPSGAYQLVSIPGGCSAHTTQLLSFGQPYNLAPSHIEFDSNNDLAIENAFGGIGTEPYTIYTFHHPDSRNGQFGKPIAVTSFISDAEGIRIFESFLADGKHLWATGAGVLSVYDYPGSGAPIFTLKGNDVAEGYMAVVPPLQP